LKRRPPANQLAAQDIRGNQPNQVEQKKKLMILSGKMEDAMEERNIDVGDQGSRMLSRVLKTNLRTKKVIPRGRTTKIPQKSLFEDV